MSDPAPETPDKLDDLLNWVAGELPYGHQVTIGVENGAAWIDVEDDHGIIIEWDADIDTPLSTQLKDIVKFCKRMEGKKNDQSSD